MTKPVSIQQRIRILGARGVSWREIARRLGVSRDTVREYATMEDCSPKPAAGKGRRSLIDACSGTVDSWLSADRLMPRKQRHTARRVYAGLVEEEGFEGSYSSVRRYVRRWREEHRSDGDGYLELDWGAGPFPRRLRARGVGIVGLRRQQRGRGVFSPVGVSCWGWCRFLGL